MKNYQIQVNALVGMSPRQIEMLRADLMRYLVGVLDLNNAELLDGVFVDIKEDK